jgi:thiol-disulfide isomerase/thioredoxin
MHVKFLLGSKVIGLIVAASVCGVALAQDAGEKPAVKYTTVGPTLSVGDKAPPLAIEKWVKGEAVTSFQKGKVYVVEFWATWCGPCIKGMPHLSELQKKYKDKGVTIIGCTSADPGNTLEKVEKMVADKGDTMGYTVAWDSERKTNEAYMKAAAQNGIPCAFIVNQEGNIAWIGHPTKMDDVLDQVVAGKFDSKAFAAEFQKGQGKQAAMMATQKEMAKIDSMMRDGKFDDAIKAIDELAASNKDVAPMLLGMKFDALLTGKKDYEAAYKVGAQIVDAAVAAKDDQQLNHVAWTIVDPKGGVENKNLNLAMKAAVKADEFTNGKDAAIIDTLARVHFLKGDTNKAIELQTKAVGLAEPEMKEELEMALKEYKAKAGKKE